MKKITLIILFVFVSTLASAQCINTTNYLSFTSDNSGLTQNLSTCIYSSEYHNIDGIIVGDDYLFTAQETGVDKYITITDASDTVIAHGPSPLTVIAITSTDIRMHVTEDAGCATAPNCHVTTMLSLTNAPSCGDPVNLGATPLAISADLSWEAPESGTPVDYNWEVQPSGTAQGTAGAPASGTVAGLMVTASGLTAETAYDFFVQANCDADGTSTWVGPFAFTTTALCPDPTGLGAANIAETMVDLTWNQSGPVSMWNIEWGAAGFTQGEGTIINDTADNPYNLTGLTGLTDYEFYVQASCGGDGTSAWVGPFAFGTIGTPPANDNVCDAIEIIVDATSAGDAFTNVYATSQTGEPEGSCFNAGINGSVWFWFTAPASGNVIVTTDIAGGTLDDTEIAVYEAPGDCSDASTMGAELGCDQDGGDVVNFNSVVELSGLTAGNMYYIQVDRWGSASDGTFGLEVQGLAACLDPTALSATNLTETTADLGWTESGSATMWNIEWGPAGFTQGSGTMVTDTTDNPYGLTGLTGETDYEFYVQANCGAGGTSAWVGPFSFSTLPAPPVNDDCSNSTALVPGADFNANPVDGTVLGATADSEAAGCGSNGPGVWYSVIIPESGSVTIETGPDQATATTGFDSVIEAFSGDCGALTSIGCDDDGAATGNYSQLALSGLTAGQTIYVRVWEYGGNESEPFAVSAFDPSLSINDVVFEGFKYYPNPVLNELNLSARHTITSINVYNVLGQEVQTITPNSLTSKVDMSALNTGAYFVKVNIEGATHTIRIMKK